MCNWIEAGSGVDEGKCIAAIRIEMKNGSTNFMIYIIHIKSSKKQTKD